MKKIIVAGCIGLGFMFSQASAQDDVSIMDLKETVYLLMKKVEMLNERQTEVFEDVTKTSRNSEILSEAMAAEIEKLKKENKELRNRQVLPEYKVSPELQNYKN
ncbi:MAG: hypothetical protein PHS42_04675 [Sulfurimonas sp.]|nr:hypothetical protein [Sulfurimonas sp.]